MPPTRASVFNAGMTVLSAATAAAVVTAYDFSQLRLVIDVGGGQGRLIAAILRANPAVRGVLLDLPSVVDAAGRLLAEASVAERCEVMGGDMFTAVPEGGDLYILSRVINSFEDDRALAVFANCRKAIGERGRLLIVELVLPDPVEVAAPASVQADLLMDLNMLVVQAGASAQVQSITPSLLRRVCAWNGSFRRAAR